MPRKTRIKTCYLIPTQGYVLSRYDQKVLAKNLKQKLHLKIASYYKNFILLKELDNA
jgi:hypothetical protein